MSRQREIRRSLRKLRGSARRISQVKAERCAHSGKVKHTESSATNIATIKGQRAYRCEACGSYHLTSNLFWR